jgi:hypothetical protein
MNSPSPSASRACKTSIEMRRRLSPGLEPIDLLLRLLEAALEVAGRLAGRSLEPEPGR